MIKRSCWDICRKYSELNIHIFFKRKERKKRRYLKRNKETNIKQCFLHYFFCDKLNNNFIFIFLGIFNLKNWLCQTTTECLMPLDGRFFPKHSWCDAQQDSEHLLPEQKIVYLINYFIHPVMHPNNYDFCNESN